MEEIAYHMAIGGKSREKRKDPNTTFKSWAPPRSPTPASSRFQSCHRLGTSALTMGLWGNIPDPNHSLHIKFFPSLSFSVSFFLFIFMCISVLPSYVSVYHVYT